MSILLDEFNGVDEDSRAHQLANARKKLKTFRAGRPSDNPNLFEPSPSPSCSRPSSTGPTPLTTDTAANVPLSRSPVDAKEKELETHFVLQPPRSPGKLRKSRSRGSMSHRRQNSSISAPGLGRGSVLSLFGDDEMMETKPMRAEVPRLEPSEIITTPATPLMEAPDLAPCPEDKEAVKSRLNAFSFGAKPPVNSRSPSPRSRINQPLLPSQLMPLDGFPSPNASPTKHQSLSTPSSRPPSLLLTRPTPLPFGSPTPAGISRTTEPPSTPPTPARTRRHSHTRSNSISLPNLKLTSRPVSLGIPNSPSFPSSPSSPSTGSRPSSTMQGARLKFEPSGRGAEAEKEKDEYRRRALEKLTGSSSPTLPESPSNEIALPELDDEDTSSVASSARPFSGFGSFSFGRPPSTSSTQSGFNWSANEDSPPLEGWSTGFNAKADESEDALEFGFTFSGTGSGSFSFGSPAPSFPSAETGLGMGLPSTMAPRPSLTRNLSVLAEVDEPEDGDFEPDPICDAIPRSPERAAAPSSPNEDDIATNSSETLVPIIAPIPSRLREFHLVSNNSPVFNQGSSSHNNTASAPGSPTKGYGAIGRGRPFPLHVSTDSPSTANSVVTTPQSAGFRRRAGPGSGSRGSSISYKKDSDSTSSSRDWSLGSIKNPLSPPQLFSELTSPPAASASASSGWGNTSRPGSSRPCPRPKSLIGLGVDNRGSGRVLGEVEEADEDGISLRNPSSRLASGDMPSEAHQNEQLHEAFKYGWLDPHAEVEMERNALREDVDLWRKRCNGLEERLDLEKKENGILRERVRKLGDRLSAMASYPVTKSDTSLVADLRTQLFGVKGELERERNERLSTAERVSELEAELARIRENEITLHQPVITNVIPPTPLTSISPFPYASPVMTPEKPSPSPDPSTSRMRAWGFPREPPQQSQPRNRESFFGLSQVLRRDSTDNEREEKVGLDLPPFLLAPTPTPMPSTSTEPHPPFRAVSDPTPTVTPATSVSTSNEGTQRSTSLTSSASSALSFFSGYLPGRSITKSTSPPPVEIKARHTTIQRLPTCADKGFVDFTRGCKCCVGDIIEL